MPTSRQLLRALETMAGVGFGIFNTNDGTVRWSDGLHVMACDTESVGRPLPLDAMADLFHAEDRPRLFEAFHQMMRGSAPIHRRFRLVRPDRTLRLLDLQPQQLVDANHYSCGWLICVLDVTEADNLARFATRERQRQQALLGFFDPDLAWLSSADARQIELVFRSDRTDVAVDTSLTQDWLELIHPDDREAMQAVSSDTSKALVRCRIAVAPGQYAWAESARMPVRDASGMLVEWFGVTRLLPEPSVSVTRSDDDSAIVGMTGATIRAARAMLDWTIPILSQRAGVSVSTIMRIEEASDPTPSTRRPATMSKLVAALSDGGVVFQHTVTGKIAISL